RHRAHNFQLDEIALEERGRYQKQTQHVYGLCREHSHRVDLRAVSYRAAEAIADAIASDNEAEKCHYGKEATIGVIGAFGADDYTPMPVLVSPTCKTEDWESVAAWCDTAAYQWDKIAASTRGPLWMMESDGDAVRQLVFHNLLMKNTLPQADPLYAELSRLQLFNLQTGPHNITMGFNPKHIFKRTLLLLIIDYNRH
ncbi:hypothetical protein BOTBODRAFT_116713, partial [Botryobasidium botryosum FD-172 SS1]